MSGKSLSWPLEKEKISSWLKEHGWKATVNGSVFTKKKKSYYLCISFELNPEGMFYTSELEDGKIVGNDMVEEKKSIFPALAGDIIEFRQWAQIQGILTYEETVRQAEGMENDKLPSKPAEDDYLARIKGVTGNDVLEIFGNTGSCKTKLAQFIAQNAQKHGKHVIYYDTEKNISPQGEKLLKGIDYVWKPKFEDLLSWSENPPDADLIIIDSLGFPVLGKFARMNMKKRGDALLGMIAVLYSLKEWCWMHKSVAIVTNQPISEMTGESEGDRRPFGDKSAFAAKEIWKTDHKPGQDKTTVSLKSWRSRDMGRGKLIALATVSDRGVALEWKI